MEEHLRFAVAYWHTFTGYWRGSVRRRHGSSRLGSAQRMDQAKARVEANFEFLEKIGIPFYCFHDRDIAPEGESLAGNEQESRRYRRICLKENMKSTGKKLLWNTANMFTNPRFVHGAGTTYNADVYAYAAAQLKKSLEVGKDLGAENYVFWGGREGYETLLNTDMELELDNLARFFHMAIALCQGNRLRRSIPDRA